MAEWKVILLQITEVPVSHIVLEIEYSEFFMGEMRNAYIFLFGKPEGKRPFGRPRHRWENINSSSRQCGGGTILIWRRIGIGGGLL
jgi:hypothetical protein